MDDGWGALLVVFLIAAVAGGGMMYDKLRGKYPRKWD
jgi:hypothetical protein